MAKQEHLKILQQGRDSWNEWREDNKYEEVDLSTADLRGKNLSGYYLWRVNLYRARLQRSNLYKADLYRANLSQANLKEANLSEADIRRADLSDGDLQMVKLCAADLSFANLTGANLQGADFENTSLAYTIFGDTDLRDARRLDRCRHKFTSTIDQMTLIKSGRLPDEFLSGCGLSKAFIKAIPSLFWLSAAPDFFSCFISYSHADAEFARRLYNTLHGIGIRCWMDEKELFPGVNLHEEIERGIRIWDKVLLCCSENSLDNSWWVDNEMETALQKEQQLFKERQRKVLVLSPLNLDGYIFDKWQSGKKAQLTSRMVADFVNWKNDDAKFQAQIEQVIRSLRVDDGGKEPPPHSKL